MNRTIPPMRDPVDLRARRIAQAERVAALAQPDVDGDRGAAADTARGVGCRRSRADVGGSAMGRGWRGRVRMRVLSRRDLMVPSERSPPTPAPDRRALPAVGGLHERVDVGRRPGEHDRAVGAGLLPALPGLARRLDPRRPGDRRRSASRPGTRRGRAGPRAAGRPPRAPRDRAAGSPRSCRRTPIQPSPIRPASRAPAGVSPPMMIGGGGTGTGMGVRLDQRVERRVARHRAAGPQRADDRDGLLEARDALGRLREVDAVRRVLLRGAADADPEDQPAAAGDLEGRRHPGDERRVAVHHVEHERPDGHVRRSRRPPSTGSSSSRRPAPSRSPRPMKWSQATDAGVARRVEPACALEPPARLGPDRAQADPDRQARRRSQPGLEQADVLGRDRVAVAAGRAERRPRAERVEVGREPPDQVEHDLLDPLGVLLEDLEARTSRRPPPCPRGRPAS